ncbi:aryl-alcohol dehydrogenase [Chromobacterium alkanivorans]|uniref:NAD(P)-dependent alcohol dehydrogenase n=1 Tax=Chromobacterium TaxID=535 RepID=UPI0006534A19|nr:MULTISPECIES: NAD(P)-dependent alcohol dehydrogenase [Chromobacterium]KMN76492.1 alcohol dehydrogenase [Chromobacterium sp. LK11]MCS3806839.1 aryl-alcohol dehydrogenase [Chromobacterium alkanivorans]MCS3821193.1 aryl-alcohol dehydrogenase [Chromobacterium alkanivorans]MCS3876176.1 aryl-alcohol dehydrogenase [Chromobacterium alkanivorans]
MNHAAYRDIQAAVTRATGAPFTIEAARLRPPRKDEVLVRIVATGMCHTDMIVRDQHYPVPLPAVLGHEGAGVVEEIGPQVQGLAVGDHVVLSYGHCGHCQPCIGGRTAYCREFFARNFGGVDQDGTCALADANGQPLHSHFFAQSSFASHALCRENNAVKVPKEAPLGLLGPLGCGVQTGAGAVIHSLGVAAGSRFAVFGAGAVGLSAVLAARLVGASLIIAVDVLPARLELALELGATHVVDSGKSNPAAAIREIAGDGVDFALESTGRPQVLRQAVDALAGMGCLGVAGAPPLGVTAEFDVNDLLQGGKTIRGVVEGDSVPKQFIPQLVDLFMQGRFAFDKLVKFYPFEQINQAAADSEKGLTLKPVLRMGG